ncbi:MAG TPA: DUF2827 family protein [Caulobacteraceae bacterium]|nr:DUF2827 family protein [Caulobacteraceae bacterium]
MRIGISILTSEGQSIWSNGLAQNVFLLGRLFRALAFVDDIVLLNCGDQAAVSTDAGAAGQSFPLVRPREAGDLDVIVELAGGLDVEWLDLQRARGARVVYYVCGHPYSSAVDPTVFSRPGYFTRADRCDEVWLLDQYTPFASMVSALHRCPARLVPIVWASDFIAQRAAEVDASGLQFGLRPGQKTWAKGGLRPAIFEPNISVTKSCTLPMLICDGAAREQPDAVAAMLVLNSLQMKDQLTFQHLVASLDLQKAGHAFFEHRHDFAGFMAHHADAVVSHQWLHPSNYLYCDALFGAYPLVHNSSWARDVGYYYPDFDVAAGARQLLNAHAHHLANLETYRANAARFLARLDPLAEANLDFYGRALLDLTGVQP